METRAEIGMLHPLRDRIDALEKRVDNIVDRLEGLVTDFYPLSREVEAMKKRAALETTESEKPAGPADGAKAPAPSSPTPDSERVRELEEALIDCARKANDVKHLLVRSGYLATSKEVTLCWKIGFAAEGALNRVESGEASDGRARQFGERARELEEERDELLGKCGAGSLAEVAVLLDRLKALAAVEELKVRELGGALELASFRLDFAANWLEHQGAPRGADNFRGYAEEARRALNRAEEG